MEPRQIITLPTEANVQANMPVGEKRYIFWGNYFDILVGKLLTVVDATIIDKSQQKAVKDIVKNTVREFMDNSSYCERCRNTERLKCSPTVCPKNDHDHYCPDCNCYRRSELI